MSLCTRSRLLSSLLARQNSIRFISTMDSTTSGQHQQRAGRYHKRPRLAGHPGHTQGVRAMSSAAVAEAKKAAPVQVHERPTQDFALNPSRPVTPSGRHFSERRFQDAPISAASKAGLSHEFMSDVQAATLDLALKGQDLLVQAKTGTGKTIAFLLPAIERLLQIKQRQPLEGISILVISPTRELALQIEQEAETLLKHHTFKVHHVIGGTNIRTESKHLIQGPCDILIATPGRLIDHLKTTPSVAQKLAHTRIVVYDEADRLLDQGFKPALDTIMGYLPKDNERQAMLFSATVSPSIKKIAIAALRPGYSFVSTLKPDEMNTHEHVPQTFIITPQEEYLPTLLSLIRADVAQHTYAGPTPGSKPLSISKLMVFFPTARQVGFAYEVLSRIKGLPPLFEIHSRKSQPARSKAAEAFKSAESAILLSSDVAARGMDFPGVTAVIQFGIPSEPEQYIHRLGRTARAGANGCGILVLSQPETCFLRASKTIRDLPIQAHTPLLDTTSTKAEVASVLPLIDADVKAATYRAWLGYYKGHVRAFGWTLPVLVKNSESFAVHALGWGEEKMPSLDPQTVGKMGLRDVKHLLNIVARQRVVKK